MDTVCRHAPGIHPDELGIHITKQRDDDTPNSPCLTHQLKMTH